APAAEAPAAGEAVEYEYVEAPAAEAPAAGEAVEYEYVEAPAAEAPAAGEAVEYEYVEAPAAEAPAAGEAVEYEYVEAPAADAPAAGEEVEYEYVEAPAAEAPAVEAEPELPPEEEIVPPAAEIPTAEPQPAAPLAEPATVEAEPELPPEEEIVPPAAEIPAAEPQSAAPLAEPAAVEAEPELPPEENPAVGFEELEAVSESRVNEKYENVENTVSAEELETLEPPAQESAVAEELPQTGNEPAENTAAIDALADETIKEESRPVDDAQVVAEETQEEYDPQDASDMIAATGAFSFDGTMTQSFTGSETMDTVVLTNVMHAFDHISEWYLLISEFSVTPLAGQSGAEIPLSDDIFCQGAFINADGSAVSFANSSSLNVPADQTNLALCGMKVIPLTGQENSTIELENSAGMLIGPGGIQLMFSHLNKLTIPAVAGQTASAEPQDGPVAYALPRLQKQEQDIFTFTADSGTAETDQAVILVKTGYSLYGWNVVFANGQTMSLADVRTYQSKHGVLPDNSGVISYKQTQLTFKNAQSIRIYEKPSYCGYGKQPEE
ncbi:MAG: hypothetical protein IJY17_06415, partial [Alphaproteobacteria bacterium]|nr:hypothetical protein [Alphaproteobacteria bacterium]